MNGLVLAAGAGSRLRPHTDDLPKALLPVDGDATILDIALANLSAVGLVDVVVVVGYRADVVVRQRPRLEDVHGVSLTLVHNDKAEQWNNCYSLWLARDHFSPGAMLLNGDTVHPVAVEHVLLSAQEQDGRHDVLLAVDDVKPLADEEMKVRLDDTGLVQRITKQMDPLDAHAEYIGAALITSDGASRLARSLESTWRRDPSLYYEDGFQTLVDEGGAVGVAPIGSQPWVEVDNLDDLNRAREIACLY